MTLFQGDGAGPLPDSQAERLAYLGVALLFLIGGVAGGFAYVQSNPGAPWQLEAAYSSVFSVTGENQLTENTTLRLSQTDASYVNRIYRELDGYTETGYCIHLIGDEMRVTKAATLEATESTLKLSTANCYVIDGTLHTHPPNSRPVLSGPETSVSEVFNDKQSLLVSSYRLSCVQAGLVTTTAGERTQALRCYTVPESDDIGDEFPEISVRIAEG
ncbi:hypothetical protein [Halomontanus rarus]|uniref:hypothetical protein n=1 Tax=Halomontanus rarus TaxID=3034020 RepID=UPI001A98F58F